MDNLSTGYSALNLPFSPEAEQSVLGAILLDSSCLDRVAEILPRPDYFYQTNNGLIYGAMLDMFTLGKPVDFVTVLEAPVEMSSNVRASATRPPKSTTRSSFISLRD